MGTNPSRFTDPSLSSPVERVTWRDCQSFLARLNARPVVREMQPELFRLPTEMEWEYACRAGGKREEWVPARYDELGWYASNSLGRTHGIGMKAANAWNLYDMHGNVWEWCQDWAGDYPAGEITDPTGPRSGRARILRGGGGSSPAESCRSACRSGVAPSTRSGYVGFRIALAPAAAVPAPTPAR